MTQTALYAQALFTQAQKDGADAKVLVNNLVKCLKESGRAKLLPGILRELNKIEEKRARLDPLVEIAHQKDVDRALKIAAEHGIHAEKTKVNHTLISGWRATGNGKLVDHSGKSELISLYQKIITP